LKRIFYILVLLIGISFGSQAQNRLGNPLAPQKLINSYPNPASSNINFDFQRGYDKTYTLEIYNFIGKKVWEVKNITPRYNLNLDNFYRGVYVYQLRDKNGIIIESGKFQVVK